MQLLQGQSLEAQEFVSSRNTWLESKYFRNLLEKTFMLNSIFSQRMKKGWLISTCLSENMKDLCVSTAPSSKIFPSPQQWHSPKISASFPKVCVHFLWENDNIPVSIFYSSAPINEITTNPKMLSSENSCSIDQYLHQDQNPNHTFFFSA